MTTVEVKRKLSDDVRAYLQRESPKHKIVLDEVVSEEIEQIVAEPLPLTDEESDETL